MAEFNLRSAGFASDNNSAVIPEVLSFLRDINSGHVHAYGGDEVTRRTELLFKEKFGAQAEVFFVFGGTAANVLSMRACLQTFESVICADTSHANVDECGAPENIAGIKLISVKTKDGKLSPDLIRPLLIRKGDQHFSQPKMVTITQPTELGTVYSLEEIRGLSHFCKENQLLLHVDGSRFVNAAVHLGVELIDLVKGVDILSFGGTKNGLMLAEAVVTINPELAKNFKFIRKQSMQLASKMRYVSGQFFLFLKEELWRQYSKHSLEMAQRLFVGVKNIEGIKVLYPVQSNALFVRIPKKVVQALRSHYFFYVWDENNWDVRWMTTFDTRAEDIDRLIFLLKQELAAASTAR